MAYNVNKSDGYSLLTLLDGEVDTSYSSLVLLGKNYLGYGEIIAENFIHLLENFAGKDRAELNALTGQLYFNKTKGVLQINTGDDYTTKAEDWRNIVAFNDGTGFEQADIKEAGTGTTHRCIKMFVKNVLVAIISSDGEFIPDQSEGLRAFCGGNQDGTDGDLGDGDYNRTGTIGKGLNLNSSSDFKIRGVAVEAEFADVAEIYVGDASYEPGTVVALGGDEEVTQTTLTADTNVFGIVSTRPAYLMNAKRKKDKNALPIAVAGRIPVKVVGAVKRGDRLVSSDIPGVAKAATGDESAWSIVGRSLGNFTGDGVGKVEATVGAR
jgi:hypothetical protein